MKKMRRFAAIAAAAAMTACMAVPMMSMMTASAYDITISNNANGSITASTHTFVAYQIFTGDLNEAKNGFVGDSVTWGSAVSGKEAEFITALKTATFGTDAEAAMNALEPADVAAADGVEAKTKSTAYQVALAIEKASSADDATLLAEVIDGFVTANSSTGKSSVSGVIGDLAGGYYFVKDTTTITNGSSNAISRFILKVTDDKAVEIKADAPTLIKKIWHNDTAAAPTIGTTAPTYSDDCSTAGWNDVGDNQIGDTVYYFTETTVPDMSDFDTYKYIIRDTFSAGLTFKAVTNIVYVPAEGAGVELLGKDGVTIDVKSEDDAWKTAVETFYVDFIDLKEVLKDAGITWKKGDKIYTYYNAVLNEKAQVSASTNSTQNNPNEAWLTYSKDANQSGSGDNVTNDSEHDIVYDWTYTFSGEKVDESGNPLDGATFSLLSGGVAMNLIAVAPTAGQINGVTAAADTLYFRPALAGENNSVTTFVTTATANKFVFFGLDDTKTYTLEETDAPTNYTKADPVDVKIGDAYKVPGKVLNSLTYTVDEEADDDGNVVIVNNKGTSLPSTGGIGTTLFYVIGGTMAAGAGVALIAKKRMKNEE